MFPKIVFLCLASPILGSIIPRASPYQTRILDTGTTFAEEDNGTWQLIDADGDGVPDLAYIKTSATSTGYVEVHIASASSNFQTRILETATTFTEENNGTWLLVPSSNSDLPNLAYIKTIGTGSNTVEVHTASGISKYATRTLDTGTVFAEETDGVWALYDYHNDGGLDLVFIKSSNTGSSDIEVHVASAASGYKTRILDTKTVFTEETNGVWALSPYSNTTATDLTYIKDVNTGSGDTEVHVASGSSGFETRVLDVASVFTEEQNGIWKLIDFNKDGLLDLTYIKYKNTGSGDVEVHVASGWNMH